MEIANRVLLNMSVCKVLTFKFPMLKRCVTPEGLGRLLLYGFGTVIMLYSAVWEPCHNAYSQAVDFSEVDVNISLYFPDIDFDISSGEDAEEMRTYTVVDGLVGPVVPVIFQDSRGALWFGSESGGVSRFDGETFEPFHLEDGFPRGATRQILEDRWGHIWFLTQLPTEAEGTLSYFNGTNIGKVGVATCMAIDSNGDIWAANNRGLTHYTSVHSSSLSEERTHNEEMKRSSVESTHHRFRGITDATIDVLFQSKDKKFWIGGSAARGILLLSFDPDVGFKDEVADVAKPPPIFTSTDGAFAIQDIAQGLYGVEHLWFAGRNLLLRFDGETIHQILPNPQSMTQSDTPAKNRNDIVLHHDRFHNRIWFSNQGSVIWSDGNSLKKLPQSHEFSGILKMQETWGDLWFASSTGAYRYHPGHWASDHHLTTYTVENGLGSDNIQTIFRGADGKIWFGHDNGVTVFNPQSAFVNFRTRSALGSDSVRRIYEDSFGGIWFSIPGGIALYEQGELHQRKFLLKQDAPEEPQLKPQVKEDQSDGMSPEVRELVKNALESQMKEAGISGKYNLVEGFEEVRNPKYTEFKSDGVLAEPEVSPRDVEIVKIFQHQRWVWLISRTEQTSTEILYTLFARALRQHKGFKQLTIRVQTETGHDHHPEVLISGPENPYIAFGGWLFKPYSEGLKWFSPQGTRTFEFQDSPQFEDLPKVKHGPSAILDMYTDEHGKIWCYLEDGTVQSYANLNTENIPEVVRPEVVPMTHIKPLRLPNPRVTSKGTSENTAPKWFFNSEKKRILYWNIEKLEEPIAVEGVFNTPPLAIWESADAAETTFIFSNGLKKYRGTQLIPEESKAEVDIAEVRAALLTDAQVLWLATKQGALRYDGITLKTYGVEDGFLVNDLRDVGEDTMGHVWFATWGGGAVRYDYDGETFSPVTTKDGLAHNNVSDIHQSRGGRIWFATEGGVTRYIPTDGALPFCNITAVKADKTYTRIPETPFAFPSQTSNITFHFEGINPLRIRYQLTYEFKLLGLGANEWTQGSTRTPTHLLQDTVTQTFATSTPTDTSTHRGPSVTYHGLKPGNYTFLVKTYRKGWPYTSTPAAVNFTIATPFWAQWRSYLPYLVIIVLLIVIVPYLLARLVMNRRRIARLRAEMQQKEDTETQRIRAELDEARNMQSGLLPTEAPQTEGLDVAGMSLPATQVGGDFYDYLSIDGKRLAIAVADAAGKGLRGALNAVLTNGMLNEIVQIQYSADVILTNLNASLIPRLYGRTFIALNLAIIDTESEQMLYANAGQPYPILKRGETLIDIEVSELPLGSMKRVEYVQEKLELVAGDVLIFYTDGVIEALNPEQEMYDTERLKSVITEAPEHLNAEEIIAYIFEDIQAFVQTAEQYDDITIVVVRHQPTTQ